MTDPYLDLRFCIINFICGIFFFICYCGVMLVQKNKNKYLIYLLDFISILIIGILYLFILDSNKITFHIYFILFITIGYLVGIKFLQKQLIMSYQTLFIILKYFNNKLKIVLDWSFDIIPIKILVQYIKIKYIKYKVKQALKKLNKKIVNEEKRP